MNPSPLASKAQKTAWILSSSEPPHNKAKPQISSIMSTMPLPSLSISPYKAVCTSSEGSDNPRSANSLRYAVEKASRAIVPSSARAAINAVRASPTGTSCNWLCSRSPASVSALPSAPVLFRSSGGTEAPAPDVGWSRRVGGIHDETNEFVETGAAKDTCVGVRTVLTVPLNGCPVAAAGMGNAAMCAPGSRVDGATAGAANCRTTTAPAGAVPARPWR
mmetsp:Transcript_107305/g.308741  ORF Transcript_107305/g.308741 Transcript_107305/m.308741 type:complete len:219 (-) Transcript_107305:186-842(-)